MSIFPTNKKIILLILGTILVTAGVFGAWHGVLAQTTTTSTAGNAIGNVFGSTSWFYGLVLAFLIMIRGFFAVLLTLSGSLLNIMFEANTKLVPSLNPVVQVGWTVLRDLANAVFILLVLWIALTIILNIEEYGGKKLLAKVLAVAILINFSLAIVTAIFAFSNQFALAFYNKIAVGAKNAKGDVDIASYIVNVTRLQSISDGLLDKDKADKLATEQAAAAKTKQEEEGLLPTSYMDMRDGMLASVGFHSANAESCFDFFNACLVRRGCTGLCPVDRAVCRAEVVNSTCSQTKAGEAIQTVTNGVNYIGDFFKGMAVETGDWSKVTFQQALNAMIGIILLGIAVTTFLYAAVALAMRYFAVIFLAIASPIAFLTIALPLNLGKSEGWSYWWKEFMKWVFFAPAFYFLIYLTLVMAQNYKTAFASTSGIPITSNPKYILAMLVVMGMLIYASRLAKKTSGKAGEVTVGLAKKLGGLAVGVTAGVATGGTLLAARGLARGAVKPGTRRDRVTQFAARYVPGGGALQRYGIAQFNQRKQDIEERKKNYGNYTNDQLLSDFRGALNKGGQLIETTRENAARLALLAERPGGFDKMDQSERQRAKSILSRYGMGDIVAKVDPTLADERTIGQKGRDAVKVGKVANAANNNSILKAEDAITYAAQNLKTQEISKVNTGVLSGDGADNEKMRQGLWMNTNMSKNALETITTNDFASGQKMVESLRTRIDKLTTERATANTAQKAEIQTELDRLERNFKPYLSSTAAQSLGFHMPSRWLDDIKIQGNMPTAQSGGGRYQANISQRLMGGSGKYEFTNGANVMVDNTVSNLTIDASGVIGGTLDPSIGPGNHIATVPVKDSTTGEVHNIEFDLSVR